MGAAIGASSAGHDTAHSDYGYIYENKSDIPIHQQPHPSLKYPRDIFEKSTYDTLYDGQDQQKIDNKWAYMKKILDINSNMTIIDYFKNNYNKVIEISGQNINPLIQMESYDYFFNHINSLNISTDNIYNIVNTEKTFITGHCNYEYDGGNTYKSWAQNKLCITQSIQYVNSIDTITDKNSDIGVANGITYYIFHVEHKFSYENYQKLINNSDAKIKYRLTESATAPTAQDTTFRFIFLNDNNNYHYSDESGDNFVKETENNDGSITLEFELDHSFITTSDIGFLKTRENEFQISSDYTMKFKVYKFPLVKDDNDENIKMFKITYKNYVSSINLDDDELGNRGITKVEITTNNYEYNYKYINSIDNTIELFMYPECYNIDDVFIADRITGIESSTINTNKTLIEYGEFLKLTRTQDILFTTSDDNNVNSIYERLFNNNVEIRYVNNYKHTFNTDYTINISEVDNLKKIMKFQKNMDYLNLNYFKKSLFHKNSFRVQ